MSEKVLIENMIKTLQEETGLPLQLATEDYTPDLIEKLSQLLQSQQKKYTKESFLFSFFKGQIADKDLPLLLKQFHIKEDTSWVLYFITSPLKIEEEDFYIIHQLTNLKTDIVIKYSSNEILILQEVKQLPEDEQLYATAASYLSALESELMKTFHISYTHGVSNFSSLQSAWHQVSLAMSIGNTFFAQEAIYNYHNLGLGKLLFHVPEEECLSYIHDSIHFQEFQQLDQEMIQTIRTFLQHNLNIAETARALFLHRNTFLYRLDKIEKVTGLDIRKYQDAVTCQIILMLSEALSSKN